MGLAVGLVADDGVYLGADAGGFTRKGECERYLNEKVFWVEDVLIATIGSWHMAAVLKHDLILPERERGEDARDYLAGKFAKKVKNLFLEAGLAGRDDSGRLQGDTFLLAYDGRLFMFQADWSVLEPAHGYAAVGCGSGEARGVLWVTKGTGMDPEARVLLALQAAARHHAFLRPPFVVDKLPK